MKIVVIDGQGGRMGSAVIEQLKSSLPEYEIYALGTNSIATSSMLKAGADYCLLLQMQISSLVRWESYWLILFSERSPLQWRVQSEKAMPIRFSFPSTAAIIM